MREKAFSSRAPCFPSPPSSSPCTITRHGLVLSQMDWICKHLQTNLMPPLCCRTGSVPTCFTYVCSCILNNQLEQLEIQFHGNGILFKLGFLLFCCRLPLWADKFWGPSALLSWLIKTSQEKNPLKAKEDTALYHCAPTFGITISKKGSNNNPSFKISLSSLFSRAIQVSSQLCYHLFSVFPHRA